MSNKNKELETRIPTLSGYRLMWMMVMFDLPTSTQEERKKYCDFRNTLLDNGFEMSQYSVYFRFVGAREKCERYIRIIKANSPPSGSISILFFTDKQFGEIINIIKKDFSRMPKAPEQLTLF